MASAAWRFYLRESFDYEPSEWLILRISSVLLALVYAGVIR